MAHSRLRIMIPVVLLLVLGGAGAFYLNAQSSPLPTSLLASGTVETDRVQVSTQLSGQVAQVLVQEGDTVKAGDALLRLDDQGLETQRTAVQAATQLAVAAAQAQLDAAQKALSDLNENAPVVTAQAEQNLANARKALDDAQKRNTWQQTGNRASQQTIDATEARLTLAKDAVDKAQAAFNHVEDKDPQDPVRALAESNLLAARQNRDDIVRLLNWYKGSPTNLDQAVLDANVSVALAAATKAESDYEKVQNGPDPTALKLATDQVVLAQAQLTNAQAQGASQLRTIDLQLNKLEIKAPSDGVVLTRSVEPGEVSLPGATLFEIGSLQNIKITVFLPEDRYGRVNIGDQAQVTVDSYPGTTFTATVSSIAEQAEFTPRNVQTQEGRKTTVFSVDLRVDNPDGRLKPGMPADVTFSLH